MILGCHTKAKPQLDLINYHQVDKDNIVVESDGPNETKIKVLQDSITMKIRLELNNEEYFIEPIYSTLKQAPMFKFKQIKNKWYLLVSNFEMTFGNMMGNYFVLELKDQKVIEKCQFLNLPEVIDGVEYDVNDKYMNDTFFIAYRNPNNLEEVINNYCPLDAQ